jgi:hypothetical protein
VTKRIPRKSHARNVAKKSSHRFCFVTSGTASVVVVKMGEKRKSGQNGIWPRFANRRQIPFIGFRTNPNR